MSKSSFPSWCCPKCGEHVGWLGRIIMFFIPGWHRCPDIYDDKNNWGV